jgi:hypothetical protein
MLPLPSRTHPQKQTPVVYTEELTHLPQLYRETIFPKYFVGYVDISHFD